MYIYMYIYIYTYIVIHFYVTRNIVFQDVMIPTISRCPTVRRASVSRTSATMSRPVPRSWGMKANGHSNLDEFGGSTWFDMV